MSVVFYCPCGGEIAPGGHAHLGGGDCLSCGKVFDNTDAIRGAGGSAAIACTRERRTVKGMCQVDGCRAVSVALCDEPTGARQTCDHRLCAAHRVVVGPNRDRCPRHAMGRQAAR